MIFVQRGFLLMVTYVLLVHFTLEICSRRAANGAANAEAKSIANARTKERWSIFQGLARVANGCFGFKPVQTVGNSGEMD